MHTVRYTKFVIPGNRLPCNWFPSTIPALLRMRGPVASARWHSTRRKSHTDGIRILLEMLHVAHHVASFVNVSAESVSAQVLLPKVGKYRLTRGWIDIESGKIFRRWFLKFLFWQLKMEMENLRESMEAAIRKAFTECQQSTSAHSSWKATLKKYLDKAVGADILEDGFLAPFWSCLDHVVSVFKRQPKVDRLLKFVANFATR